MKIRFITPFSFPSILKIIPYPKPHQNEKSKGLTLALIHLKVIHSR